jgi:hypothetical protein
MLQQILHRTAAVVLLVLIAGYGTHPPAAAPLEPSGEGASQNLTTFEANFNRPNRRRCRGVQVSPRALTTSVANPQEEVSVRVLSEDFENGGASAAWSDRTVAACPNGRTKFLGPFGPGTVTLNLAELPAHRALRVSFALHILGSWDGVGRWGPDRWRCGLREGPTFLDTTFNNCFLIWCDNVWQSFPELYSPVQQTLFKTMPSLPSMLLACHGGSGATGLADLGWNWSKYKGKEYKEISTTYRFSFVVPHAGPAAVIDFTNLCDDPKYDQSFALDDVSVETLHNVPALAARDIELAWQSLFCGSPSAAFTASTVFLAHPDELLRRANQLVTADETRVSVLMDRLDAGPTRAEGVFADMEPGDDVERIAALREMTIMPGDLWQRRQQEDPFDPEHPQRTRTLQCWIYPMYNPKAMTFTPLVRAGMRLSALLRQNGCPEALKMAETIEERVSLNKLPLAE